MLTSRTYFRQPDCPTNAKKEDQIGYWTLGDKHTFTFPPFMNKRVSSVSCVKFPTPKRKLGDISERAANNVPALSARSQKCAGDYTRVSMVEETNINNYDFSCLAPNECHNIHSGLLGKAKLGISWTDEEESWCTFFLFVSRCLFLVVPR